jgi:hypothetical protein
MSAPATTYVTSAPLGLAALLVRSAARVSRLLWVMCAAQVFLVTGALARWFATGEQEGAVYFLRHQGHYLLIGLAVAQYLLAVAAWRLFERGHPMRSAWLFLMGASGFRLLALAVTSFFGGLASGDAQTTAGASVSPAPAIREVGLAITNPLSLALLAMGLFVVLKLHKQVGLLRRPALLDSVLLVVVGAFLAGRFYLLVRWPAPILNGFSWTRDPLLALLLFQAILIRRSPLHEDGGLIGRSWGAYPVAILLTCVGDMGISLAGVSSATWHYFYLSSCLWALASLAYALGPAYQVEAILRARNPWLGAR